MSLPVHWVPSLGDAKVGSVVEVEGDEAHHAVAVRRLRVGEPVMLTDGLGRSAIGHVASTGKRALSMTVDKVVDQPLPEPVVTVVQAIPKGNRGELAVEVLTEIGVARVVPVVGLALGRGLEGRARPTSRSSAGARRPGRRRSRRAGRGSPASTTWRRRPTSRRWSPAPTSPWCCTRRPGRRSRRCASRTPARWWSWSAPRAGSPTRSWRRSRAAGAHVVRLGAEVLRTSTAGVAAVAALLSRTRALGLAGQERRDPVELLVEPGLLGLGQRCGTGRRRPACRPRPATAPRASRPRTPSRTARRSRPSSSCA